MGGIIKTLYCTSAVLQSLQLGEDAKKLDVIFIEHFDDTIKNIKERNKVIKFEDITHPLFNPKENSVIVFDRRMIERDFMYLMREYGISFREKLYNLWKERNVSVVFNFAFWEALEYETTLYDLITFDFPFKHLKLTDYPLFENKGNFIFDRLYNLFHYFTENLSSNDHKTNVLYGDELQINNVPRRRHTLDKKYLFSSMQMKLRPHRLDFIKKLVSKNLHKYGYITGTREYFGEYKENLLEDIITTDNNSLQNQYFYVDLDQQREFFEKEWEDHTDIFVDGMGGDIWDNHTANYNDKLEYDLSYIDIPGETHILYNTMYPIFTEKSLTPIFFHKMFLLYGGNCFYEVLDKLGGHNFKDELLLPDNYFTMNNPYEQVDIIVNSLEQLSKIEFSEVFQESQDKILENKVLLLEHYKKIMKPVKQFILG